MSLKKKIFSWILCSFPLIIFSILKCFYSLATTSPFPCSISAYFSSSHWHSSLPPQDSSSARSEAQGTGQCLHNPRDSHSSRVYQWPLRWLLWNFSIQFIYWAPFIWQLFFKSYYAFQGIIVVCVILCLHWEICHYSKFNTFISFFKSSLFFPSLLLLSIASPLF